MLTIIVIRSGNNDDQTNFRIEKEFENAAAKGLRPCSYSSFYFTKSSKRLSKRVCRPKV